MADAAKRDTGKKELLVRIGVAMLTEKGFHNTPIEELVAAAGVPIADTASPDMMW